MRKKSIFKSSLILIASIIVISCKKDDIASPSTPSTNTGTDLGTFAGVIQVNDDPQTNAGNINNATVNVKLNGTVATITVKGNLGVDREYTGNVISNASGITNISISKQTKPSVKNAGSSLIIQGNNLSIQITVLDETVKVIELFKTNEITLSGKLALIGSNLVKL